MKKHTVCNPREAPYSLLRGKFYQCGVDTYALMEFLDRSRDYVIDRTTGKRPWNMDEVYALCEWLDIPVEQIHLYFPKGGKLGKTKIREVI